MRRRLIIPSRSPFQGTELRASVTVPASEAAGGAGDFAGGLAGGFAGGFDCAVETPAPSRKARQPVYRSSRDLIRDPLGRRVLFVARLPEMCNPYGGILPRMRLRLGVTCALVLLAAAPCGAGLIRAGRPAFDVASLAPWEGRTIGEIELQGL